MVRPEATVLAPQGRVDVSGVHVQYDRVSAVKELSLSIGAGEWLGIIGANGAGKSTLLRAIARLVTYDGTVRIDGRDTSSLTRREFAQLVAYVPQSPEFPAQMRAIDYVALGRTPHHGYFGAESAHDRQLCHSLLERIGASSLTLRRLDTMSGGELQRLVLARALVQEAPILLLDEPTSALDLGRRVEALELIDELRHERRLTVVSTLHDLTLAAQFADRLLLLAQGCAVALGTAREVLIEESLNEFFGTRVEILRNQQDDIVVVPRRSHVKGTHE